MGLGDVTSLVIPKPVLIRPRPRVARWRGAISCLMPATRRFAVTGAVAVATACGTPGTLAAALVGPADLPRNITIEHPTGRIDMRMERAIGATEPQHPSYAPRVASSTARCTLSCPAFLNRRKPLKTTAQQKAESNRHFRRPPSRMIQGS